MDKQQTGAPGIKETTVHVNGNDYKVISHFEGKETASKLLCDLAVRRIMYENSTPGHMISQQN